MNDIDTKLSGIDKALAAARARKAAKESIGDGDSKPARAESKRSVVPKATAKIAKDVDRLERQAQRRIERDARRAAKAAAKADAKKPHMKKIEKAAGALPKLTAPAELLFNEATANFSAEQITAIALHLQHFNRVKATERALNQKLEVGQQVRIVGGPTKFVGMTGTIDHAQRIRCFVAIPGIKKPVYLFTSDVELVAEMQATGTEG